MTQSHAWSALAGALQSHGHQSAGFAAGPWLPNFGVVVHVGRKSGRAYRTPVNVFSTGERQFVFALTYGPKTEWVQNLLASGGAHLEYHGSLLSWRIRA